MTPLSPWAWKAKLDQADATLRDVAALMATYYATLQENGVPADHAALLTAAYQTSLLAKAEGGTA